MPRERQRFCGGEGGEDRTPGRLKTRGFDLLIKEDCAGSLAESRLGGAWMLFRRGATSPEKAVQESLFQEVVLLEGGNGWDGLDLQNLAVKACAGEGGKKRGREEETGNVGAG